MTLSLADYLFPFLPEKEKTKINPENPVYPGAPGEAWLIL